MTLPRLHLEAIARRALYLESPVGKRLPHGASELAALNWILRIMGAVYPDDLADATLAAETKSRATVEKLQQQGAPQ